MSAAATTDQVDVIVADEEVKPKRRSKRTTRSTRSTTSAAAKKRKPKKTSKASEDMSTVMDDLRSQMREEVRDKLKEELMPVVRAELRTELTEEVKECLRVEFRDDLMARMQEEIKEEVWDTVAAECREQMREDIALEKQEIERQLREDLHESVVLQLRRELAATQNTTTTVVSGVPTPTLVVTQPIVTAAAARTFSRNGKRAR